MSARFQIIDIGHRGYSLDRALSELEASVSDCVFGGKTRAIKVIHGHGTGALKRGVREWCEDQTGRFQAVIIGESYDLFDPISHTKTNLITLQQQKNRLLLKEIMEQFNFMNYELEWWHFSFQSLTPYPLLNFPIQ